MRPYHPLIGLTSMLIRLTGGQVTLSALGAVGPRHTVAKLRGSRTPGRREAAQIRAADEPGHHRMLDQSVVRCRPAQLPHHAMKRYPSLGRAARGVESGILHPLIGQDIA